MKIGLALPVFTDGRRRPLAFAARAAGLGFDGVFAPDHLFPPMFYRRRARSAVARGVLHARRRVGAATRHDRRDARHARDAAPAGAAGEAGRGARSDQRRARRSSRSGPGTTHPIARARDVRLPVPADRRAARPARGDGARAEGAVPRRAWAGGDHVPALAGPLLPPRARRRSARLGGRRGGRGASTSRPVWPTAWNGWGARRRGRSRRRPAGCAPAAGTSRRRGAASRSSGGTGADLEGLLADRAGRGLSVGDALDRHGGGAARVRRPARRAGARVGDLPARRAGRPPRRDRAGAARREQRGAEAREARGARRVLAATRRPGRRGARTARRADRRAVPRAARGPRGARPSWRSGRSAREVPTDPLIARLVRARVSRVALPRIVDGRAGAARLASG